MLLVASMSGCMGVLLAPAAIEDRIVRFHTTVEFTVVDAESGAPLPGATVTVGYAGWGGMVPGPVAGVTDAAGRVALRVVKDRNPGASASAAGYLPSVDGGLGRDPPAAMTLRAYRAPPPFHVLEVPKDFRGELRFRVLTPGLERDDPRARSDWRPGQRAFVTRLVPGQVVDMHPLPQMGVPVYDIDAILEARDTEGKPVTMWMRHGFHGAPPPGSGDALWYLGLGSYVDRAQMSNILVVYLGTLDEAEVAQERLRREWKATLVEGLYLVAPLPGDPTTVSAPPPG